MDSNTVQLSQSELKPQSSSKRSARALFTLAYMVSFELNKFLKMPAVKSLVNTAHLEKF